jgi:nucleotide-binding universal stress UspA family protein
MEAADNVPTYLPEAQDYLEQHHISATYVSDAGPVGETILQVAGTRGCDFLILGGYGRNPVLELLLGSTVDYILRKSAKPMLICR